MIALPIGSIIDWYPEPPGATQVDVDDVWVICDGRTLAAGDHEMTPNAALGAFTVPALINKYRIGAEPSYPAGTAGNATPSNSSGAAPGPGGAIGSNAPVLTTNHMPQHTHTCDTHAGHTHTGTTALSGDHYHLQDPGLHSHRATSEGKPYIFDPDNGTDPDIRHAGSGSRVFRVAGGASPQTGEQQAHTDITTSTAGTHQHLFTSDSGGSHTHAIGNAGQTSPTAVDNRPQSVGAVPIIKVKR